MQLPNAERAEVPPEKLRSYLLSGSHPVGRFKARFFRAFGYTSENWEAFAEVLQSIARFGDAEEVRSPHGRKFRIPAELSGPDGVRARILTIWILSSEESPPRFVTACPEE